MLKQWMATYLDDYVFTQMDDSPTSVHFGGDATSTADIDASDTITPALLDEAVASSMKADPKVWPIRVGGRAWYVVVIHPDVAYDLKQHATWTSAQRDATPRSKEENAIFSGAMGYWGGTAIYVSEKVPISTTYGNPATVNGASNLFCGRQAGVWAWGRRPKGWEKLFDYQNRRGFAIGCIFGFTKAVFDSSDHGFKALRTARTSN